MTHREYMEQHRNATNLQPSLRHPGIFVSSDLPNWNTYRQVLEIRWPRVYTRLHHASIFFCAPTDRMGQVARLFCILGNGSYYENLITINLIQDRGTLEQMLEVCVEQHAKVLEQSLIEMGAQRFNASWDTLRAADAERQAQSVGVRLRQTTIMGSSSNGPINTPQNREPEIWRDSPDAAERRASPIIPYRPWQR